MTVSTFAQTNLRPVFLKHFASEEQQIMLFQEIPAQTFSFINTTSIDLYIITLHIIRYGNMLKMFT